MDLEICIPMKFFCFVPKWGPRTYLAWLARWQLWAALGIIVGVLGITLPPAVASRGQHNFNKSKNRSLFESMKLGTTQSGYWSTSDLTFGDL